MKKKIRGLDDFWRLLSLNAPGVMFISRPTVILEYRARTATEMDGTLHTDFRKSITSRDIKKNF